MSKRNFLKAALAMAFALLMLAVTGGVTPAQAQVGPCPVYWVNYNYVYPPEPTGFPVTVNFVSGTDTHTENADGHYTYNWDPAWGQAISLTLYGQTFPILPVPNQQFQIQTPYGILRVEIRWDASNCRLEIRLSY